METKGLEYAMKMTNELAFSIKKEYWNLALVDHLGTLEKLFIHLIRVRSIYSNGLKSGIISFPGHLPSPDLNIKTELTNSCITLLEAFKFCNYNILIFNGSKLTVEEVYGMSIQHEGIHQGQFSIALRANKIPLPKMWVSDWHL
ncbi:damage-inducible protein DinB [Bacillus sp. Marseille-P3800]|uniref:damage-inducible protein DinB n=1 Tax=Bacillus sp. Marseille-P3800 TaxID=2014782 RepID=UPI000C06F0D8|nr:damage-inducible protein DinB [Bacillus sp. Marseille-P3800]